QSAKDEPERSADGDHVAGVPAAPPDVSHTSHCFPNPPPRDFPGETSLEMERENQVLPVATTAPGSPGTAAMSEQPAASEEASLHGSSVAGLLQSVQQLLVQILQTVSHLHLLSHSLVQVGESLHQLLLRPQTLTGPLSHYGPHVPLYEGGPRVPCSPGSPHTSPDHKEDPQVS
ncbi:hypothetical protein N312_08990, partial [Balearica regulorum gibbericeps]